MSTDRRLYRTIAAGDRPTMRILDATTNGQEEFLCGGDTRIESFFYIGPENNKSSMDISGLSTISLIIKALRAGNEPPTPDDPAIVAVTTAQINPCTWEEWQGGAQGHAVFEISEAHFSLAPGVYWLAYWAVAKNGNVFAINAGKVTFKQDGVGTNTTVIPPPPGTIDWSMIKGVPTTFAASANGSIALYKTTSGKWVSVTATGPAGGPTTLAISQEYDSPDAIPPSETPLAQTITLVSGTSFNVGDGFVVSAPGDISWLTVNSVVGIDGKGRAVVVSTSGSNITLKVTEVNFSSTVVTGDVMRAIQIAGPSGAKGDNGDTVAEDRLNALEAARRPLGGVSSTGMAGETGFSGYAYRTPISLNVDRTFVFSVEGGDYLKPSGYFNAGTFLGGSDFRVWCTNGSGAKLVLTGEGKPELTLAPTALLTGQRWNWALCFKSSTKQAWVRINGVTYPSVTIPWNLTEIIRFLSAHEAGYGEFAGRCDRHYIYNRILSDSEIDNALKYGVAVADKNGKVLANNWVNGRAGFGLWNTFTVGINTLQLASTTGGAGCNLPFGKVLNPGTILSFEANAKDVSGTIRFSLFNGVAGNDAGVIFRKGTGSISSAGTVSVEVELVTKADQFAVVSYDVGSTVTFENMVTKINGVVVNVGPNSFSSKARGLDDSNGCNDLILGSNTNIVSLLDLVQQRAFPVSWPSVTIPAQSTQTITIDGSTLSLPALSAVRAGDSLTFSSDATALPAGIMLSAVQSKTNGTATLTLANVKTTAVTSGIITGTLTHSF